MSPTAERLGRGRDKVGEVEAVGVDGLLHRHDCSAVDEHLKIGAVHLDEVRKSSRPRCLRVRGERAVVAVLAHEADTDISWDSLKRSVSAVRADRSTDVIECHIVTGTGFTEAVVAAPIGKVDDVWFFGATSGEEQAAIPTPATPRPRRARKSLRSMALTLPGAES